MLIKRRNPSLELRRRERGTVMAWGHMTSGGWLLMSGFWLLIAVVVTIVIVRAVAGRSTVVIDGTARARGILDERFARGEIDTEEYRERLEELNQHRLPS
jgi:putative membrane protein